MINEVMERKAQLSKATPTRHATLRAVAETISLKNVDQSICELFNEALARLVLLVYETDAGGLCNIDVTTGRILIPLPFGRLGHAKWGLRPSEANILRQVLFDWQYPGPALFLYDKTRRAWFVNLYDYGDVDAAKVWLGKHQVSIAVYRSARAKRIAGG